MKDESDRNLDHLIVGDLGTYSPLLTM